MIRFAADENFDRRVVTGVRRLDPAIDILTVQDAGRTGAADPDVLAWAAADGRVVLTHDVQTMIRFAYDRVRTGDPMAGLGVVRLPCDHAAVIESIVTAAYCSDPADWADQVHYLPL